MAPAVTAPLAPVPRGTLRRPAPRRDAATPTPLVSVVIVNFRQWANTARLTRQVLASDSTGAGEVVVIDNHSPPSPHAVRLRRTPGVTVRRFGRNRGFARAVNAGCRLGRGRWILLLNPDVTVPPDFLDRVLARVHALSAEEPNAGVVGFGLRNPDGTPQGSWGPLPTLGRTLAGLFWPRSHRKCPPQPTQHRREVPWVTGCCLLVRRDCWRGLGGFDEDFFLYYEDVDLCRRARNAGWAVWYEPTPAVVHHFPLHGRRVPPVLRMVTRHALLTYSAKHWPRWQSRALAGIVRLEAWARRMSAAWRGDATAAGLFAELGTLAGELARGRAVRARHRLLRAARHLDHKQPAPVPATVAGVPVVVEPGHAGAG
jgi:N-acetylglucosaminyl-diphospho-decaprenol L-rhamnosyltransferase